jgi:hypothetical protein
MSLYPLSIQRCTHIKINGTQCGSPALRRGRFCLFHKNWREQSILNRKAAANTRPTIHLPVFEDAESIQVAPMQVLRLILAGQIEPKTGSLLLCGLQTASLNLKHTHFEPLRTTVVIDPNSVDETPLGASLWAPEDFEDEDEDEEDEEENEDEEEEEEDGDDDEDEDSGYSVQKKAAQKATLPTSRNQPGKTSEMSCATASLEIGIELRPKPAPLADSQPARPPALKAGGTEG